MMLNCSGKEDNPLPCCRDKLRVASETSAAVFGNLEELHDFHAGVLFPELERCGANPAAVARAFVDNCAELRALYSDQCRNMHSAHRCGSACNLFLFFYSDSTWPCLDPA